MASTMPFLMPDGQKLQDVLRVEHRRAQKSSKSHKGGDSAATGKQQQADLVVALARSLRSRSAPTTNQEQELAELRALESVGVRRRRRWLNEKELRDLAGPMSASDMASLFNPVPFGAPHESALQRIREDPETAAIWDSFRNIDPEKEARVLEKWETYNASVRSSAPTPEPPGPVAAAALALRRWSTVSKPTRAALRKANVHSVLALETQVLELLEQADPSARLTLPLEDAFGRMLVHGLAQFHGLMSASCKGHGADGEATAVEVHFPPHRQAQQQAQQQAQGEGQQAAERVPEITCTDVLMALSEMGGGGLTHDGLSRFVRKHIHGLSTETSSEAGDWVVV